MQGPGQATGHTDGLQPGLAPVMAQITFAGLAGNGIQMGHTVGAGRHAGAAARAAVGIDMDDVLLVQPHGLMRTGTKAGRTRTVHTGHEAQGQADLALCQSGHTAQLATQGHGDPMPLAAVDLAGLAVDAAVLVKDDAGGSAHRFSSRA